jgi:dihydroxy-acid dehydratase
LTLDRTIRPSLMRGGGANSRTMWLTGIPSTDGRRVATRRGPFIGYVGPELTLGGPIALMQDGDPISIDIPAGKLDLLVPDAELARRRGGRKPPKPPDRGLLGLYARQVTSTERGAVWSGAEQG